MVFSEEPFIPWELVHMKEPGKRLGAEPLFLAQKGLVRWLHNFGWPPQTLGLRKDRRRYIAPDYPHPDYKLPQAQAEAAHLAKTARRDRGHSGAQRRAQACCMRAARSICFTSPGMAWPSMTTSPMRS